MNFKHKNKNDMSLNLYNKILVSANQLSINYFSLDMRTSR